MKVDEYINGYAAELTQSFATIDSDAFEGIIGLFIQAYKQRKQIIVAGNGGSAGTANHFVCDFGKNAVQNDARRFKVLSLSDNVEKITALANDISFESIFAEQLKNLAEPGDLLVLVSASGNSPNILRAAEAARHAGCKVVGLTGFQGGKLKELADININVPLNSYEQIEDVHLILLHMVVYWFRNNPGALEG